MYYNVIFLYLSEYTQFSDTLVIDFNITLETKIKNNTHGEPHGRPHGEPHSRPHGGPYARLHGGPHGRPHEEPHSRPHGEPGGSPIQRGDVKLNNARLTSPV